MAALALNDLSPREDGFQLRHPNHTAVFSPSGLIFTPKWSGQVWRWKLTHVAADEIPLNNIKVGQVPPVNAAPGTVTYPRGGLKEQYIGRERSLEQRFIIPEPLPLTGANLIIEGRVESEGIFEPAADGWTWRTEGGSVWLGQVIVYDDQGVEIPATMQATATATRIRVDGAALAQAAYPVVVDPEIGANDFRVSEMGGDRDFDAVTPAVIYNPTENHYLVVWRGDDDRDQLTNGEFEIFGQLLDANTGSEIGADDFRISDMGPDGNANFDAISPKVVYNPSENEYLVVWIGDDDTGEMVEGEFEIFAQRLDGATGAEIGANDFRISDMGSDGDPLFDVEDLAAAYNETENEYLVVWEGDDNTDGLVDGELEIFGQRLDAATGAEIGGDFRISIMGPNGEPGFDARDPALVFNPTGNAYLVLWRGDTNTDGLVAGEFEVFGQHLDGASGAKIGAAFRISDMGPTGDPNFDTRDPEGVYNTTDNQFLVVWEGEDDTGDLVAGDFEIFGQRLDAATGAEIGGDFRISNMGPDGNTNYNALNPTVVYNAAANEFLVFWEGDRNSGGLTNDEFEIFAQRLDASSAAEIGSDFRVSFAGLDGSTIASAQEPASVYNPTKGESLVVWQSDDTTSGLVDEEFEIFGQRLDANTGGAAGEGFQISSMGPDGDFNFDAFDPVAAYNDIENEYLVVWSGDDNSQGTADNEFEIFGQRLDGTTGNEIGVDFRISSMGPDGDLLFAARNPALAFNPNSNRYLVVWEGSDNTDGLAAFEFEIYGQFLDGSTGAGIGGHFRISQMGPDGDTNFDAGKPSVAYNPVWNEYLVVWEGDSDTGGLVNNEFEIFGQRLDGETGAEIGANDFRISDMGPDGDTSFAARDPAVTYNREDNNYLVIWSGDDNTGGLVDEEFEIFGQHLSGITGDEVGTEFRISDMGPDGNADFDAFTPSIVYNFEEDEYLVLWTGDDAAGLANDEFEVFAQILDGATGAEIGSEFRVSHMGLDGNAAYDALDPAANYNPFEKEYLVTWSGDHHAGGLVDEEFEIFGQRLDAVTGTAVDGHLRLSDMGSDGDSRFSAANPGTIYNPTENEYLVVWEGDDDTLRLVDEEFEIFAQRLQIVMLPEPDFLYFFPIVLR